MPHQKKAVLMNEPEIILVRIIQTSSVAPNQWNAWDVHGGYWYMRFRHGIGTIGKTYNTEEAVHCFYDSGVPDITLEDMLQYLGVSYKPEAEMLPGTIWENAPKM